MTVRALCVALALAACGGNLAVASPTVTARPSASPTPTIVSASPTALVSARGFITVSRPAANARLRPPITISGDASVFEAALTWRITDSAGRVLASGHMNASAGAPARGDYTITATFPAPASDTIAIVEVYELSPRDGSIDEIVRVPVVITP